MKFMQEVNLVEKIKQLPPQKIAEVEDFVEFLQQKEEKKLVQSAMKLSEDTFRKVWDNDADSVYDELELCVAVDEVIEIYEEDGVALPTRKEIVLQTV